MRQPLSPKEGSVASTSRTATPTERELKSATRDLTAENTPSSPVVESLARQVANGLVLYTNYKHYHWQTHGPLFRDLHKLFDEFAREVLESIDELAERIRMIGQDPPGLPQMLELATVAPAASGGTMREMVEEADRHSILVISEMRKAASVADEHEDPGTVDLFSKIVQVHEKQEWWLRELLRQDGLSS
jgi:starvation-inducible DNA-binding protein